jgi:peptide/nickel transport system permease protein
LQPPNWSHLLGTDNFGRDVFSRLIHGARVSVYIGLVAVVIASTVGVSIGVVSGFYGGVVDGILMRLVDVMLSFPSILFALVLITLLGPSVLSLIITMGIIYSPRMARLARAGTLSARNEVYVESARAVGVPNRRILLRYVLPNIVGPLVVQASLLLPIAILVEATLSFLGLGVQPPTPSWGAMLSAGRAYMEIAPWLTIFPGVAIAIIVLSVNLLGDAAQDWANPRLRRRR